MKSLFISQLIFITIYNYNILVINEDNLIVILNLVINS
jgi:hypothetical protein